ncbi:MAG: PQQ-binding-like beta-propeller repeat protein [Anaerolineaceae bacterium]|nr:PQQ-binding-like beta-propeller repeat protein [Anaerolineaceae bacterium]
MRFRLAILALTMLLLVAACGPAPLGTSWAGVSILGDNQQILIAFNSQIELVDPTDGSAVKLVNSEGQVRLDDAGNPRIWKVTGSDARTLFFSNPIAENTDSAETLIFASYNRRLFRVDVSTARMENPEGFEIPEYTGSIVANLVADDNLIYVGLSNHDLIALDRTDFSVRWTFPTEHGVWSAPLLLDGVLYFTSLDHNLYAVDAATGDSVWSLDLGGAALGTPAYANGRLYVGSFARKLFAVSLQGEQLDEFQTVDWIWGTPTIIDNTLYAADLSGNVYALNISNGFAELWQTKVSEKSIRPSPLVVDNTVIVASSDQKVYWLSADNGFVNFSRELASAIFSDLLLIEPSDTVDISEPLVVVSTMSPAEALVAFTVGQGERRWVYALQ